MYEEQLYDSHTGWIGNGYRHHSSFSKLRASADDGCILCKAIVFEADLESHQNQTKSAGQEGIRLFLSNDAYHDDKEDRRGKADIAVYEESLRQRISTLGVYTDNGR